MKQELPIFPLGTTYIPGDLVQLHIFEDRYIQMCSDIEASNSEFVSVLIERGHEVGGGDIRSSYGVAVVVDDLFRADGRILLSGHATHSVEISEWLPDNPYPRGVCAALDFQMPLGVSTHSGLDALRALLTRLESAEAIALNDEISRILELEDVPLDLLGDLFWAVVRLIPSGPQDRYRILKNQSWMTQLTLLSEMITHFKEISEFQSR